MVHGLENDASSIALDDLEFFATLHCDRDQTGLK